MRTTLSDIDEEAFLVPEPLASAVNIAAAKANTIASGEDDVVLTADTLVVDDHDVLGKPINPTAAREMLLRLRARVHHVITGVVVRSQTLEWASAVDTRVVMRPYTDAEVDRYIARGEPFDKAGGYAIQDDLFRPVDRVEGCYLNVVGLPLCAVAAGLTALGSEVERAGAPPCVYCERGKELVRSGH